MALHRIAILSDTHSLIRPGVEEILPTCEKILHAGDISDPETYSRLKAAGELVIVRGNNDREWALEIPYEKSFLLYNKKFYMTHRKSDVPADVDADVIIYGHSHRYDMHRDGNILWLNPGSCGPRRWDQAITMMVMTISDEGEIDIERIDFDPSGQIISAKPKDENLAGEKTKVTTKLVEKICHATDKGKTTAEIAKKYGISSELSETIVRMYLTHPGVTPEKIMAKLGL